MSDLLCVSFHLSNSDSRCDQRRLSESQFCETHMKRTRVSYHSYKTAELKYNKHNESTERHAASLSVRPSHGTRMAYKELKRLSKLLSHVCNLRSKFIDTWIHPTCRDAGHLNAILTLEQSRADIEQTATNELNNYFQQKLKESVKEQEKHKQLEERLLCQRAKEAREAQESHETVRAKRKEFKIQEQKRIRDWETQKKLDERIQKQRESDALRIFEEEASCEFKNQCSDIKADVIKNCFDPHVQNLFEEARRKLSAIYQALVPFMSAPSVEHDVLVFLKATLYRKLPKNLLELWGEQFATTARICAYMHHLEGFNTIQWPILERVLLDGVLRIHSASAVSVLMNTSLSSSYEKYVLNWNRLTTKDIYRDLRIAECLGTQYTVDPGYTQIMEAMVIMLSNCIRARAIK